MSEKTQTTPTTESPKRWAVFTWFGDNGLPPPTESEIDDLLCKIEKVNLGHSQIGERQTEDVVHAERDGRRECRNIQTLNPAEMEYD